MLVTGRFQLDVKVALRPAPRKLLSPFDQQEQGLFLQLVQAEIPHLLFGFEAIEIQMIDFKPAYVALEKHIGWTGDFFAGHTQTANEISDC